MTRIAEPRTGPDAHRLLALICAAHFISHFYIVILAPVLTLVRADFGVSYTQIGLAFFAFNLTSAVFQTHAGYLVDRRNAGAVLIGGLIDRRGRAARRGAVLLLLAVHRDVRAARPWQHGLPSGRLRVARATYSARAHEPCVCAAHLRRHGRFGRSRR